MSQKPKALLSVYHKEGIVDFAKTLISLGWEIIASGGTAKALAEAGLTVTDVATITGREAVLGHRVVTLAPEIHGGLMASPAQREELEQLGWPWIDLVCVDLYPLLEEIQNPDATADSVIEKTDIGGPTMLRSAAKGGRIVIADPQDRESVLRWLRAGKPDEQEFLRTLRAKTEAVVAAYVLESARYHSGGAIDGVIGARVLACKYGENAGQVPAGLYVSAPEDPLALGNFTPLAGDAPSYNNLADVDRLLQTLTHISTGFQQNFGHAPLISIGVKHGNACGAAVGQNSISVLENMLQGDPLAIFGGVVMTNFPIGMQEAHTLRHAGMEGEQKRLLDTVVAPSFSEEAMSELNRKGGKCRMLANSALMSARVSTLHNTPRRRPVRGGFLSQPDYVSVLDLSHPDIEMSAPLNAQQKEDIVLAWAIGSTSNSNTITLVKDGMLQGNGVGQQDRVGAAQLALVRARRSRHQTQRTTAYSDSFFPFTDAVATLAEAGITTVFASRGSVRDSDILDFCNQKKVTLVTFPDAQIRGFYMH